MGRQSVALNYRTGRHLGGLGLGVVLADPLGDGFELFGHAPHVVVVATGYHCCALDVTIDQDLGCQQDQPGFGLAPEEPLHDFTAACHFALYSAMKFAGNCDTQLQ